MILCTHCDTRFGDDEPRCPKCGARVVWVDPPSDSRSFFIGLVFWSIVILGVVGYFGYIGVSYLLRDTEQAAAHRFLRAAYAGEADAAMRQCAPDTPFVNRGDVEALKGTEFVKFAFTKDAAECRAVMRWQKQQWLAIVRIKSVGGQLLVDSVGVIKDVRDVEDLKD
jgi:hypothetical protein